MQDQDMEQKKQQNKNKSFVVNDSFKDSVYNNFLGFLIKDGKKKKAKSILDTAFLKSSKELKIPVHLILIKIFFKLNCFVETKKIRIRRSTHVVPFSITFKRKSYLIIKWIMESVSEDERKLSTSEKLHFELVNILKNKSCKTLAKKDLNLNQALSNRSNIHYRW
jgi:ribosomal protein S7